MRFATLASFGMKHQRVEPIAGLGAATDKIDADFELPFKQGRITTIAVSQWPLFRWDFIPPGIPQGTAHLDSRLAGVQGRGVWLVVSCPHNASQAEQMPWQENEPDPFGATARSRTSSGKQHAIRVGNDCRDDVAKRLDRLRHSIRTFAAAPYVRPRCHRCCGASRPSRRRGRSGYG